MKARPLAAFLDLSAKLTASLSGEGALPDGEPNRGLLS